MSPSIDPRLVRLLGGEPLAALRRRLRRRFEQDDPDNATTSLRLTGLSEAEYSALAGLLGLPARHRSSIQIEVATVDTAMKNAGIAPTLRAALEALDGPIVDRAAERARIQALWYALADSCEPSLGVWLKSAHALGLLKRLARHNIAVGTGLCRGAAAVLRCLPARGLPRAQLAAQTLGDAHALDDGQPVAALVIGLLRQQRAETGGATAAERRRETWALVGVLVNELARPALCLNLPAAGPAGEPTYLSLRRLLRTPSVWLVQGEDVYVCENPNLVAIAADRLGALCRPLLCTEGMPAAAQRTLLTQVVSAGARLHYHGDFDWPGLAIGNHMVRAYGVLPWRFSAEDYEAALPHAPQPGLALLGQTVTADWDTTLTGVMQLGGMAIAEEAVADSLLPDLAAGA